MWLEMQVRNTYVCNGKIFGMHLGDIRRLALSEFAEGKIRAKRFANKQMASFLKKLAI